MSDGITSVLQKAWDGIDTLPPLAFSEDEAVVLVAALAPRAYPTDLPLALTEVLGTPNYALHPFWMALREVGFPVKTRYEEEQAAALHFLIPFALEHGADWERFAIARLVELREQKARKA